jgi:hypothetical protein
MLGRIHYIPVLPPPSGEGVHFLHALKLDLCSILWIELRLDARDKDGFKLDCFQVRSKNQAWLMGGRVEIKDCAMVQ